MINRVYFREMLAWVAVLLSLVLFSATVAFAQETTVNVTNENGKVHVEMKTMENGKTTTVDTTFDANDNTDIEKIVEGLSGKKEGSAIKTKVYVKDDKDKKIKHNQMMFDLDLPEISEKDRKRIEKDIQKSMDQMKEGLTEMCRSLKNMSIHIEGIDDNDFNFEFNIDDDTDSVRDGDFDSLSDDEHIVIIGDEDEKPPVLEKVINENGRKVFVFKRDTQEKTEKGSSGWIDNFKCFPNPSSGKFNVEFKVPDTDDISITVSDENGKSIYSEKLKKFKGNYSKEINLADKGKGTFLLTVSDAENSVTQKIMIN